MTQKFFMYVYFYSLHVSGNHVDDRLVHAPVGRPHRVTYTRYRIHMVNSPDDGHMVARNMWRIEINIHEKFVRHVGLFTKIETFCSVTNILTFARNTTVFFFI